MRIIHIGSEFSPIAKVGGLGDVIYGLSKQQIDLGYQVLVILPKYRTLQTKELKGLTLHSKKILTIDSSTSIEVCYWKGESLGIPLVFIEPKAPFALFDRDTIYGEKDDVFRFMLFSYLVVDYLMNQDQGNLMIHCHDWQSAFAPVFYHELFKSASTIHLPFLLTIHNLMHQGRERNILLDFFHLSHKQEFEDPRESHLLNLLKAGMLYADKITTVSPTYAKEILTPFFSYYLDETLWKCKDKIEGILNGIPLDYWSPFNPSDILFPFPQKPTIQDIFKIKKLNKNALQNKLHLKPSDTPLFCVISRLDIQKSPAMIAHASKFLVQNECQMVILGKTHDIGTRHMLRDLEDSLKPSLQFYFREDFDEDLAKALYMSCDFILIPSSFEPCGLTQMIAMRYGTVAVARKTGGLADTVIEEPKENQTGFSFPDLTENSMDEAIRRAISFYQKKEEFGALVHRNFTLDHSWKRSAKRYLEVYSELQK